MAEKISCEYGCKSCDARFQVILRKDSEIKSLEAVNHTLSESYHKSQGRCRDLERLVRNAEILLGGRADVPQFDWAKERKKWLSEKERILK